MILTRFAYTPTETQGRLIIGDWSCLTIERPWVRGDYPGGAPFQSCVPDGVYELRPHVRPNGDQSLALVNEDAGVYYREAQRPKDEYGQRQGRYLILIHPGNTIDDVVGCIAPGAQRRLGENRIHVTNSRATMVELLRRSRGQRTLEIRRTSGANDIPLRTLP